MKKTKIPTTIQGNPKQKLKTPVRAWLFLLLLTVVVSILFLPSSWFDFVNMDDPSLIYNNPVVINPNLSYFDCFRGFLFSPYYKPLVLLSWRLEYQLLGPGAGHFHLFNWLLHLGNTFLVFGVGMKMMRRWIPERSQLLLASFFLAVLFAVNPLRVESVCWATERKDVLFSFFLLLSWLSYLLYLDSRRYLFIILGALFYLASCLSKSMGVPFLAILFLIDLNQDIKFSWRSIFRKTPYYLAFLTLLVLYGFFKFLSKESQPAFSSSSFAGYIVGAQHQITSLSYIVSLPKELQVVITTSCRIVLWFLHCFVPVNLSVDYPHNKIYGYIGQAIFLYPIVVLLLLFVAWKKRLRHPYFLVGILFFGISLSPVLFIPESGQGIFMSNRYTYIPSIGLFYFFIIYLFQIKDQIWLRNAILTLLSCIYFIGSIKALPNWRNSETLFTQALKVYPQSGMAHLNLGLYYNEQKDYDNALKSYTQGIRFSRSYLKMFYYRSKIYFNRGQLDSALNDLNYCLSQSPDISEALIDRGVIFGMRNEFDKALADFKRAHQLKPDNATVLSNLSFAYYNKGLYFEAAETLNDYLRLKPKDSNHIDLLGLCLMKTGKFDQALYQFNKAIALNPLKGSYYYNRANLYRNLRKSKEERLDLLKAKELGFPIDPSLLQE